MKSFIVSVLCAAVFFTGLGALVEEAGATFKSDERALELLRKARLAVGGEAAIGGVRSMTITGKVTKTFEVEGAARSENGELEINFELPNQLAKKVKLGAGDGNVLIDKQIDVTVLRKGDGENLPFKVENGDGVRKFTITKKDGSTEVVDIDGKEPVILRKTDGNVIVSEDGKTANVDGNKVIVRRDAAMMNGEKVRSNELFRTTLALLLSAPQGLDVSYTYAGEGSVDGALCDIIAASDGGSTIRLYLDRATSLPRMMAFQGPKPFMIFMRKNDTPPTTDAEVKVFERRTAEPQMAEFQVKFADYRAVGGLQLPFRWTQTVGGKDDELVEITSYDVNPANIAEKFKETPTKVFFRTKKEQ